MLKKWQLLTVCIGLLGVSWQALAADNAQFLPTDDKNGCAAFIQNGDMDLPPPVLSSDIARLQLCMASCNDLYQSLGKKAGLSEMLRGVSYCRKSLNNLYYASVSQTIYDQLDAQTQQDNAVKKAQLANKIKQWAQQRPATPANNAKNNTATNPDPADADHSDGNSSANNNLSKGPSEDINWF